MTLNGLLRVQSRVRRRVNSEVTQPVLFSTDMSGPSSSPVPSGITFSHHAAIGAIKALNYAYDILTLPFYTVIQQPWIKWNNR